MIKIRETFALLAFLGLAGCEQLGQAFIPPEDWKVQAQREADEAGAAAIAAEAKIPAQPARSAPGPSYVNEPYTRAQYEADKRKVDQQLRSLTPEQRAENEQGMREQEYHRQLDHYNEVNHLSRICDSYGCQ